MTSRKSVVGSALVLVVVAACGGGSAPTSTEASTTTVSTAPTTVAVSTTTTITTTTTTTIATTTSTEAPTVGFGEFGHQCIGVNNVAYFRGLLGDEPRFDEMGAVVAIEGVEFLNSAVLVVPFSDVSVPFTIAEPPASEAHAMLAFNHTRHLQFPFRWVQGARAGITVLGAGQETYATWDGNTIEYTDGTPSEDASFLELMRVDLGTSIEAEDRAPAWEQVVAWAEDMSATLSSVSGWTDFSFDSVSHLEEIAGDLDEIEAVLCDLAAAEYVDAEALYTAHQTDSAWLADNEQAFHRMTSTQQLLLAHEYAQLTVEIMERDDVDWLRAISDDEIVTDLDGRTSVYEEIVLWSFAAMDSFNGALFLESDYVAPDS